MFTKKELAFLTVVTARNTLSGSFNFEGNTDKEFKKLYELEMTEVEEIAESVRKKIFGPGQQWNKKDFTKAVDLLLQKKQHR